MRAAIALMGNTIQDEEALTTLVKDLTQDEKYILAQYVGILKMSQSAPEQFQSAMNNIISQSLG
jgi:hypothetical protein